MNKIYEGDDINVFSGSKEELTENEYNQNDNQLESYIDFYERMKKRQLYNSRGSLLIGLFNLGKDKWKCILITITFIF